AWLPTVLIVAGTVTSLLTLYVIGLTFNLAFWRDPADVEEPNEDLVDEFSERKKTLLAGRKWTSQIGVPPAMVVATSVVVIASISVTLGADLLWVNENRAAENLQTPGDYITSVLGEDVG